MDQNHNSDAAFRRLEAKNAILMAALQEIGKYTGEGSSYSTPWQDIVVSLGEIARTAIKSVEE